ncbi:cysteine dioxygenase family protein (plasmid) [Microvirga terrae]|uniref:Cysteine dioxygenase family protein n=1 Tax=Microvirga terrae TaxID=2740529 RepID=A0ABY5RY60_9HYPH|nr:cysteine dioxygenase family protein [Microvirga terrae]UVF22210.1 cysteine dioxygenase family protein [Microvirga terrae]
MMNTFASHDMPSLFEQLSKVGQTSSEAYLENAHGVLQRIVSMPDLIDGISIEPKTGAYTRTLLFGDRHISVWAMRWGPGSRTAIHDHHCSCCFGMVSGTLVERRYSAIDERRATLSQELVRPSGFVACFLPSGPNVHQMSNDYSDEAISLHIYGFDHRMHASSVHREYEAVELSV